MLANRTSFEVVAYNPLGRTRRTNIIIPLYAASRTPYPVPCLSCSLPSTITDTVPLLTCMYMSKYYS